MRHVSIAELKANAEELIAAAEAGEEIAIVREGRDVVRITGFGSRPPELVDMRTPEQRERQRAAVDALYELGQQIRAQHGPTTAAEIREWIDEGRP